MDFTEFDQLLERVSNYVNGLKDENGSLRNERDSFKSKFEQITEYFKRMLGE